MPTVNLTEAAARAGVSRTTLYKKIQQGKISLNKLPDGSRGVDVAELGRVFGNLERSSGCKQVAHVDIQNAQLDVHRLQAENAMLREQVVMYRTQLEQSLHERNRLLSILEQRLLPAPVEEKPKARKSTIRKAKAPPPEPVARKKPEPPKAAARPAPKPPKAKPVPKKPVARASKAKPAGKAPSPAVAQDESLGEMFKRRWGSEGGRSGKAPSKKPEPKPVKVAPKGKAPMKRKR